MVGGVIGEIWYFADSKGRRIAEQQLAFALKLTPSDAKIRAKACFQLMAKNLVDMIRMGHWSKEYMGQMVSVEGYEHYLAADAKNKGIVALAGHIGQFELLAAWFAYVKERKVAVIGRKLYDKRLDALLVAQRQKFNLVNIATVDSPLSIMRVLGKGYALGVLLDQDSSNVKGYFADFYGKKALTAAWRKGDLSSILLPLWRNHDVEALVRSRSCCLRAHGCGIIPMPADGSPSRGK